MGIWPILLMTSKIVSIWSSRCKCAAPPTDGQGVN
jgi:hypothetical protein